MRTRLARLGTVTAAPAQAADQWNPPAHLVQPLDEVWNHVESTYPDLYGFRNYGWDQVMANRGSVNYCVRRESDAPVSAALRDRIHTALATAAGTTPGRTRAWGRPAVRARLRTLPPGRAHLRARRLLRLDPDRPVLLFDEGRFRRADHRVRPVDVP
ncbi:hypothetical protein [Streptomyces ferrugineus]|uniref:hypothetical protein n=1 Tax=Streptomyces ferrugineus TaxID=1413221 RepID=UPI001D155878|nr:hypothetical protein [Streptomyces ferrugineus]